MLLKANNPRWSWQSATWLVLANTSCSLSTQLKDLLENMEDVNVCMKFLWVIWGELLQRKNIYIYVVKYVSAHGYITGCAGY